MKTEPIRSRPVRGRIIPTPPFLSWWGRRQWSVLSAGFRGDRAGIAIGHSDGFSKKKARQAHSISSPRPGSTAGGVRAGAAGLLPGRGVGEWVGGGRPRVLIVLDSAPRFYWT